MHQRTEEPEMDGGDAGRFHRAAFDSELEELKQMLRARDEELGALKTKYKEEMEIRVCELQAQHDQDITKLKQLQVRKLFMTALVGNINFVLLIACY